MTQMTRPCPEGLSPATPPPPPPKKPDYPATCGNILRAKEIAREAESELAERPLIKDEVDALARIAEALNGRDERARWRMLEWAASRFANAVLVRK